MHIYIYIYIYTHIQHSSYRSSVLWVGGGNLCFFSNAALAPSAGTPAEQFSPPQRGVYIYIYICTHIYIYIYTCICLVVVINILLLLLLLLVMIMIITLVILITMIIVIIMILIMIIIMIILIIYSMLNTGLPSSNLARSRAARPWRLQRWARNIMWYLVINYDLQYNT